MYQIITLESNHHIYDVGSEIKIGNSSLLYLVIESSFALGEDTIQYKITPCSR